MQKVVKFLEGYIQWVALGLGLMWVLYIGYAYWAKPAAVATLTTPSGPVTVGPGDVDDTTNAQDGPIAKLKLGLENRMPTPKPVDDFLKNAGTQYVSEFKDKMELKSVSVNTIPAMYNGLVAEPSKTGPTTNQSDEKVPLPVIMASAMTAEAISNGLSVAWVPNPSKPVDVTANNTPVPEIGRVNAQAQPAAEAPKTWTPPNAGTDVVPVMMETKDVTWVTDTVRWNMKELTKSFKAANIPDPQATTLFLRVRLVREEQMPDGSWGNKKYVDDLTNQRKLPWPPKTPEEEGVYVDWAGKAQADIVEPPFYEVLRGNLWRTASMPEMADAGDPNQPQAGTDFDPATVKPGDISKLSPENLKKWREWKAEQDAQERDRRKSEAEGRKSQQKSTTPGGGGGGGGGTPSRGGGGGGGGAGGGKYAPPPANDQPLSNRKYVPNAAPPAVNADGVGPGRGASRGEGNPNANRGGETVSQPNQPQQPSDFFHGEIPQGRFTPATAHDLEIWAHDDTGVPGHTYRYKLEVSLLNPLYKTQNLAKNPADEAKLAITLETDWAAPVTLPTKQKFFAVNGGNNNFGGAKMNFEYFWWEDGSWKSKAMTVQPGDAIPSTGWTVVDLKPVPNGENKAVLVNETGDMVSHYYKTDLKDPEYARLKGLVSKAVTATPPQQTGSITP